MNNFSSENRIGKIEGKTIPLTMIFFLLLFLITACGDDTKEKTGVGQENPKVAKLKLQPGFEAEHLYSPVDHDQGSWVAMTFDDKGRIITSDQYGSLYRLEINESVDIEPKVEKLVIGDPATVSEDSVGMGYAQGLLWAFNSLYVMVNNHSSNEDFSKGSGLYRLQDMDGDDQFETITLLKTLNGSGEHGPHSVVLSPDKQSLYVVAGNHTDVPEMDTYRVPPVWDYDNLFPEIKDPRGHANDREAPGGWIAKVDSLGQNWELVSVGHRNAYDVAFNDMGDLFTYDSDMEWDFGLPWYRPTRIVHATSGSEFGWRTGNGKWSSYYPDNLPAVLNIGQGSPTNLVYGSQTNFPEKYRKSFFAFDWSFGIIYAVFPEPDGASYSAEAEEFLSGSPLPLTDGVIGPDGALYFITGGRRLESDLYRVSYTGGEDINSKIAATKRTEESRIREQLEELHTGEKEGALDLAWPYLDHSDRFVRYAARIAVEHQPVGQWQQRALNEKNPQARTQAIIALSRQSQQDLGNEMLQALNAIDYGNLNEQEQQDVLRAYELVLYRNKNISVPVNRQVVSNLSEQYPAESNKLNRSLSKILAYLEAPNIVETTLELLAEAEDDNDQKTFTESSNLIARNPQYGLDIAAMLANTPPGQQVYYATVLSEVESGWTPNLHEEYFTWIRSSFDYQGGRSYVGFIDEARQRALSNVPENRFAYYDELSGASLVTGRGIDLANVTGPEGPGRQWTVDEALSVVEDNLHNRDFERGKQLYAATLCISCHTMGSEGGIIGPDLTQLGNRFSVRDILQATIHPSDVISDQYASTMFELKDGRTITGTLIRENEETYFVSQNPFTPQEIREIAKTEVSGTKKSDVSVMLPGLINGLNPEELKDLMAYLISGGMEGHEAFKDALE